MTSTDAPTAAGPGLALSGNDLARRKGLRRMRLIATSLLVVAAVVFVVTHGQDGWVSYVNAASEAAMVGAIADWFAVTALFRHPLGLPIPHTAIIPKRKASLGESLQEFVADNFLRDDIVRERVLSAGVAKQAGTWVLEGEHAQRLVEEGSRILSDGLSRIRRSDVAAVVQEALVPRMADEPLAPVAGQLLGEIVEDRAHSGLVDLMTEELLRWLGRNGSDVLAIVEERAPWWTPQWLDEKVADRIYREAVRWVRDIHEDVNHPARLALDSWLADLAVALQEDAETQERFERLKVRLLEQPQLSSTSIALWDAFRRSLIGALADPDGLLRRRALDELLTLAHRLQDDEVLARRIDTVLADVAGYAVSHYGNQVATIISATVDRWDGKETADRVELHVGRDLQFIRINGTVVGGLAGLVIHTLAELL